MGCVNMKIFNLVLKAVPLAMGIAVVVLSRLNSIDVQTAIAMLGLGLACLGISAIRPLQNE